MFGYVTPFKPELKMREWALYRAYYCGLCHEIKRKYGQLPRMALNYDFVLLAMLADSMAQTIPTHEAKRCAASCFTKKCVCAHSHGLEIAADSLMLSVYYKLCDDSLDEKGFKKCMSSGLKLFMKKQYNTARTAQPKLDEIMKVQMSLQVKAELKLTASPDEAADATAQMTASIFKLAASDEKTSKILYRLGLFLGKIIYYLDAAEDYEDDIKNKKYNVFSHYNKHAAVDEVKMLCNMCAGEAALCYNLLNIFENKELIENIIFLGLPQSIMLAGIKRKKEKDKD